GWHGALPGTECARSLSRGFRAEARGASGVRMKSLMLPGFRRTAAASGLRVYAVEEIGSMRSPDGAEAESGADEVFDASRIPPHAAASGLHLHCRRACKRWSPLPLWERGSKGG